MDTFNAPVWILMTLLHTFLCRTSDGCEDSCVGKANGNYQYCSDCLQYMACSGGNKYIMSCSPGLVWDDIKKMCYLTSSTCTTSNKNSKAATSNNDLSMETVTTGSESAITTTTTSETEEETSDAMGCDASCTGKTNGKYQYCNDCQHYMTCIDGHKLIMPCPSNLVWDDGKKMCFLNSSTCKTSTTGCDDSCVGKTTGQYQYCSDCRHYITCIDGNKYIMPCPSNLLWDDIKKMCYLTSSTCTTSNKNSKAATSNNDLSVETVTTGSESAITTTTTSETEEETSDAMGCDASCTGKTNGNYQYCNDCQHYMTCIDGHKHIMPCPSNLVWDDGKKMCFLTSSTCKTSNSGCDDSCVGKTTGQYQYCSDCRHYMTCIDGYKYIMPCPTNLLWDDQRKMCFWTSSTCTTPNNDPTKASTNTGLSVENDSTIP